MVSFLLRRLKYRWPRVKQGFGAKSFPRVVLLISTSWIELVLHPPHCHSTPQSLRVAVINWWQSSSPRSSSGPGSLMPVFWSTHQHFPRWPSRAGWHCGHKRCIEYFSYIRAASSTTCLNIKADLINVFFFLLKWKFSIFQPGPYFPTFERTTLNWSSIERELRSRETD